MGLKKGTHGHGKIIDGKRYCRICQEFHKLEFMCPEYGLKLENAVKQYVSSINMKMSQIGSRGRKK